MLFVSDFDETLAFCTAEPIERVLLEDVARRSLERFAVRAADRVIALCHVDVNLVPAGEACGAAQRGIRDLC